MLHPDPATPALLDADGDLYVFGYGSLLWRPGFAHAAAHPALLRGYHRRFCIRSRRYRGTPEQPGLVLGLDRGGACRGLAFQVPGAAAAPVLAYLQAREMPDLGPGVPDYVYQRRLLPVRLLEGGRTVRAVAYVADRRHAGYCRPCAVTAAAAISAGVGQMGPNRDYLLHTVAELRAMGVRDATLDRIVALLPPG